MTAFPIAPKAVRYVKLGPNGRWEDFAVKNGLLRLGFDTESPSTFAMCKEGRWEDLATDWAQAKAKSVATRFANETRVYFEDVGEILWITFAGDSLYWGFTEPGLPEVSESDGEGTFRRIKGGWSCRDVNDALLSKSALPGSITKSAFFRGTSFFLSDRDANRLVARINGHRLPEVDRVRSAQEELRNAIVPLIQRLDDKDFEALVDMLFIGAGWRRLGRIGGTSRDKDLDLEMPLTGERAFVQVKCMTNQAALEAYIRRLDEMQPYDRMFFVYHTSSRGISTDREDVDVLGPDKVAAMVVDRGFVDWVLQKVS